MEPRGETFGALRGGTRFRTFLGALVACSVAALPAVARADDEPARREVPRYDGRAEEPTSAGDVALWVPRIALAPLWLVAEYGIRRPVGLVVVTLERGPFGGAPQGAGAEANRLTLLPSAGVDYGFRPIVGGYARWSQPFAPSVLHAYAGTFGEGRIEVHLEDRIAPPERPWAIVVNGGWIHRDDLLYYGTEAARLDETRYAIDRIDASGALELRLAQSSRARASVGLSAYDFDEEVCCGDRSIESLVDQGMIDAAPPGYPEGYTAFRQGLSVEIDTRPRDVIDATGVYLGARAEHALDLESRSTARWIRAGFGAGGTIALWSHERSLHVRASADLVEATAGEVPFTELVSLGGDGPLPGFVAGDVLGRSGAALRVEHTWPVWLDLDGVVSIATGNAFAARFDDFEPERLRLSFLAGVRSAKPVHHVFEILAGFGTETFEDGTEPSSFRLVIGTRPTF